MPVLVDTSVWSLVLRRRRSASLNPEEAAVKIALQRLIEDGQARIIGVIRQEILSGVRQPAQYDSLRTHLRAFADEPLLMDDFETAAIFANKCRAAGSTVDFLICAVAARRNWPIFTRDDDFRRYARLLPVPLYSAQKES
jgi:predicted nucleic acid-binding protein